MFFNSNYIKNENRVKEALILEKHINPEKIRKVIKSDMLNILKNYGDVKEDVYFDILILDDGSYEVNLKAKLDHLKLFQSFN